MVGRGDTVADALNATRVIAQAAEARGYRRIWYAEHHNMSSITSAATAVLIAHVAGNTRRILLGSGGVMLPNHSPLAIAEQFGTLASLHPGRIELGLGRAPGSDPATTHALRRDQASAEAFPQDVLELQAFLAGESLVPGVQAIPGAGTHVPLTILGSSLFGAQLAAHLGLRYGFASHFAPEALVDAVALYRRMFTPSGQSEVPHVTAAMNVVVAESPEAAEDLLEQVRRRRVASFLGRGYGREFTEDEIDQLIGTPQAAQILGMMRHTAVGTPPQVRTQLEEFQSFADADELIVVINAVTTEGRLRCLNLLADAYA